MMKKILFSILLLSVFSCKEPRVPNLVNPNLPDNGGVKNPTDSTSTTAGSTDEKPVVINQKNLIGTFECELKTKFLKFDNQIIRLSIEKITEGKVQIKFYGYCKNTEDITIEAVLDTPTSFVINNESANGEKISGKGYFNSINELEVIISSQNNLTFRLFKVSDLVAYRFQPTTINDFYPEYVFVGEELILRGKDFYSTMKIFFDEIQGEITFMNKEMVKIKIPDLKRETLNVRYTDGFCSNIQAPKPLKFKTNRWYEARELTGPTRWYALGTAGNGNGYVGLGLDENRERLNDFWEFNIASNSWIKMPNFIGSPRNAAVSFTIKNKIYVGTGYYTSSLKDFFEFDLITKTWKKVADLPAGAREHATAFAANGKGYVVGGKGPSGWYSDLWEYDADKNEWTRKKDFPAGRAFMTALIFGDMVMIGGGVGTNGIWSDEWYVYDAKKDTWTLKTKFLTENDPFGFVTENLGYVIYDLGKKMALYDLENNRWRSIPIPNDLAYSHPTIFQIGNRVFYGTGHNGNYSRKFWEYVQ